MDTAVTQPSSTREGENEVKPPWGLRGRLTRPPGASRALTAFRPCPDPQSVRSVKGALELFPGMFASLFPGGLALANLHPARLRIQERALLWKRDFYTHVENASRPRESMSTTLRTGASAGGEQSRPHSRRRPHGRGPGTEATTRTAPSCSGAKEPR